jgi:acyl-CoA synthetase (AMP-forming)/AMP-acid ligase II
MVMPNTAEWPIVLLGAMEAGIIVSTANPSYTGGKYTNTARITFDRYGQVCDEYGQLGK